MNLASVVLFTGQLERCIAFYRALGVPLEDEDHGDGHVHSAVDLDGVHIAIFPGTGPGPALPHRATGATFIGFWVPSLGAAKDAAVSLGATLISDHQTCQWGCRVVLTDPDGRAVELNQHDHCSAVGGQRRPSAGAGS